MTTAANPALGQADGRPGRNSVTGGLIGRGAQVAQLQTLVADAASGRGRCAWVEGEPGIGKTALLAAGLDQAEATGCQFFTAHADELGPAFPLRALLDALRVSP